MRLLLDTHILLWYAEDPGRLGRMRAILDDPGNQLHASRATWWELAIKVQTGKLRVDIDQLRGLTTVARIAELGIEWQHMRRVASLPRHHRDPFDHLLVAQAMTEGMRLVTDDRALVPYSDLVWCIT